MSLRSGRTCADLSCSNSRGKLQLWKKYWIWSTSVDFREILRLDIMSDSLGEQRITMFTRGHHHFDPLWMICTPEIILKFLFLKHATCSLIDYLYKVLDHRSGACFFLSSASSLRSIVVTNVLYLLFWLMSICRTHKINMSKLILISQFAFNLYCCISFVCIYFTHFNLNYTV